MAKSAINLRYDPARLGVIPTQVRTDSDRVLKYKHLLNVFIPDQENATGQAAKSDKAVFSPRLSNRQQIRDIFSEETAFSTQTQPHHLLNQPAKTRLPTDRIQLMLRIAIATGSV